MKTAIIASAVLAIAIFAATLSAGGAGAQQNICQPNPDPVDASDPSIIVTAPASGATVTSPVHVAGQARVFEATVSLTLYDAGGSEITSTTTNAAEGQVLSAFSADVSFTVTSDTPACLWVFEVSARDGSPVNVVQVPLTLRATGLPPTGSSGPTDAVPMLGWLIAGLALAGAGLVAAGRLGTRRG
jgi:hypothetical protein